MRPKKIRISSSRISWTTAIFSSIFDGEQIAPLMKFYQPAFDAVSGDL